MAEQAENGNVGVNDIRPDEVVGVRQEDGSAAVLPGEEVEVVLDGKNSLSSAGGGNLSGSMHGERLRFGWIEPVGTGGGEP